MYFLDKFWTRGPDPTITLFLTQTQPNLNTEVTQEVPVGGEV